MCLLAHSDINIIASCFRFGGYRLCITSVLAPPKILYLFILPTRQKMSVPGMEMSWNSGEVMLRTPQRYAKSLSEWSRHNLNQEGIFSYTVDMGSGMHGSCAPSGVKSIAGTSLYG